MRLAARAAATVGWAGLAWICPLIASFAFSPGFEPGLMSAFATTLVHGLASAIFLQEALARGLVSVRRVARPAYGAAIGATFFIVLWSLDMLALSADPRTSRALDGRLMGLADAPSRVHMAACYSASHSLPLIAIGWLGGRLARLPTPPSRAHGALTRPSHAKVE